MVSHYPVKERSTTELCDTVRAARALLEQLDQTGPARDPRGTVGFAMACDRLRSCLEKLDRLA